MSNLLHTSCYPANALIDRLELNVYDFSIPNFNPLNFSKLVEVLCERQYYCSYPSATSARLIRRRGVQPGGTCKLILSNSNSEFPPKLNFYWNLKLNPTRSLRQSLSAGTFGDEFSLDGRDNWLPTSWFLSQGSEYVRSLMAEEIEKDLASLFREVDACLELLGIHVESHEVRPNVSISRIEVYYQIPFTNPDCFVAELGEILRSAFHRGTKTVYSHLEFGWERQSECVKAEISPGLSVKVYGKTNRSVRLEFTADKNRIRKLADTNVVDIPFGASILGVAAVIAAAGSRSLRPVLERPPQTVADCNPWDVVHRICLACPNGEISLFIIAALGRTGAVSTSPPLYTVIPKLRKKKILRPLSRGRYQLDPELEWVRPYLLAIADGLQCHPSESNTLPDLPPVESGAVLPTAVIPGGGNGKHMLASASQRPGGHPALLEGNSEQSVGQANSSGLANQEKEVSCSY